MPGPPPAGAGLSISGPRMPSLTRHENEGHALDTQSFSPEAAQDACHQIIRIVLRAFGDRVPNVFQAGLMVHFMELYPLLITLFKLPADCQLQQVLKHLLELTADAAGARVAATVAAALLPVLLDKAGDSNARIQAAASDAILYLAGCKPANLVSQAASLVQPVRQQSAWRPVLLRLQLLARIVPVLGVNGPAGGEGLPLEPLMRFVGAAFASANADVRSAAVGLTSQAGILGLSSAQITVTSSDFAAQVQNMAGVAAVQKLLPHNINPKIKEQLMAALSNGSPNEQLLPSPGSKAPRRVPSDAEKAQPAVKTSSGQQQPMPPLSEPRAEGLLFV